MDKKTRVNRWLNDSSCVTEILDNTTDVVDKIGSFIIHSRLQFTSELLQKSEKKTKAKEVHVQLNNRLAYAWQGTPLS